jgi:hypothetical protein
MVISIFSRCRIPWAIKVKIASRYDPEYDKKTIRTDHAPIDFTIRPDRIYAEYPAVSVIAKLYPDTAVEMRPFPIRATASTGGSECRVCF